MTATSRKAMADQMRKLKPALVSAWFRDWDEEVGTFLATLPEADRSFARFHVASEIDKRASRVAQEQALGRSAAIIWAQSDWELIRARVQSQKHSAWREQSGNHEG